MRKRQKTKYKKQNTISYDLIIIGTGPAGLSAALYAFRYKLKTLILGNKVGGNLLYTLEIENFPGQKKIKGSELANIFLESIKGNVKILKEEVSEVSRIKNRFNIRTEKQSFQSRKIILALGTERGKLKIPGEKEFEKRGVSYCAICDAPLFKNKTVAVAGGGNAALHAANLLSLYAKEVFLLARREFRADPILIDQVKRNKKIKMFKDIKILEIKGTDFVAEVILSRKILGKIKLDVQGVFVEAGIKPDVKIIKGFKLKKDKKGFIKVNDKMETSIPGLYAAGDISTGSSGLRQIVTAAAEGAIAATSVYRELSTRGGSFNRKERKNGK